MTLKIIVLTLNGRLPTIVARRSIINVDVYREEIVPGDVCVYSAWP